MSHQLAKFGYFGITKVFVASLLSVLVCVLVNAPVSAASYLNVSSSSSGTISFGKVKPSSSGTSATALDTLTVNTNCSTGYNVYVSAQNGKGTSLVNTDSNIISNNTIATSSAAIGSATVLSNNTWGISADSTSTTTGAYVGLPTYANALNTPLTTKSNVAEQTTVPIYYGAKIDTTIVPGTYTGDVLYTVLPDHNCSEYTLKFNTNNATASTLTDQTYTVNALVDLATYSSSNKISRTNYHLVGWKDQNGNSYSTTDIVDVNPNDLSEVTLTAQWEINLHTITVSNGFVGGTSHTANITDGGIRSGNYDNSLSTKEVISMAGISSVPSDPDAAGVPEVARLRALITYGTESCCDSLYVFEGTYTGNVTSNMSAGQLATYKGESSSPVTVTLEIPGDTATFAFYSDGSVVSYGYYAKIIPLDADGNEITSFAVGSSVPITSSPGAGYHLSSWSSDSGGSFASSTAGKTTFTVPDADATLSFTTSPNTYTIAYNGSSPTSGSVSSQTGLSYAGSVTLRANGYSKSGYDFLGWSHSSGSSSATYSASTSYSVSTLANTAGVATRNNGTITLYAAWQIVTFQTADSCAKIAVNTSGSLKDSRDNQTYGVYRWSSSGTAGTDYPTSLAGYCIMTKYLKLGYVTGGSITKGADLVLTTDDSAGSGTITARASYSAYSTSNTSAQYINGPQSGSEDYTSQTYYSYPAAIKVCPKGWAPPTKTQYENIRNFLGGNNSTGSSALRSSPYNFVYTGDVYTKSSPGWGTVGERGFTWTSTTSGSSKAYRFRIMSSAVELLDRDRFVGSPVRCIAEGSSGSSGCFTAGTKVQTTMSGETKAIEDIKIGDRVVSYDPENQKYYLTEVLDTVIHDGEERFTRLARLSLENGATLEMTMNHPILTTDGYKALQNQDYPALTKDDTIITTAGAYKISDIDIYGTEPTVVYNLTVRGREGDTADGPTHSYIANGVIVHNAVTGGT